jgi:histidinol phosphatase-like PHP family hydrolase
LGKFKIKVISDEAVDPNFGTGVVKVTPAHDPADFEMGLRHNLEIKQVIDFYGRLNEKTGPYQGLTIEEARKKVVEDLEKKGLIEKIDNDYIHRVALCYKCGKVIEPIVLDNQWFIKMTESPKSGGLSLRDMAVKSGLKINEYGVFREKDNKKIGGKEEKDIYRILGLPYIPPELREDTGEIEAAITGRLPQLVELKDIKGDLHVHSKWSDGSHDFEELIQEAKKRGYEYIAITDHSKGLSIARGLNAERLMEEKKEIDAINKKLKGFRLIVGTEVDIRSDGHMDFPDDILREMDIVVASIHSGFKQNREQITRRLVSAMRNPYVSVIAHPTGRLIGEREPYDVDMNEVLKVAKETRTAIEINAYPLRLDLNDIYAKLA